MKTYLAKTSTMLVLLCSMVALTTFSSCEKEGQTHPGKPKPKPRDPNECNLTGTVRDYTGKLDGCGWLIYADNGEVIEPYGIPSSFILRDGMRIKFSYQIVETFASVCMNGVGGEITCIKEIKTPPTPDACKAIVVVNDPILGGCFPPPVIDAHIEGNCLKITKGFSGCSDDITRFDLAWDGLYDTQNNQTLVNVELRDVLANEIICQAYFEKVLSFDLTPLKRNPSEPIHINLPGWYKELVY